MRQKVYPNLVRVGKMTADDCRREIETMESIYQHLKQERDSESQRSQPSLDLG